MGLNELKEQDLRGKIWFMPTDTIPGISALYGDTQSLERIYNVKRRERSKPVITLCADLGQLTSVIGRALSNEEQRIIDSVSGRPTTVIIDEIPIRIVSEPEIVRVLQEIGPLYSTSCNRAGEGALLLPEDAKKEFGEELDFYVEYKLEEGVASTIIKIIR